MSILLGPYDIGYTPSNQDLQRVRKLSRRRTVSTSFEQASHDRILRDDVGKKSKSYAYEMEELPRLDLKKTALMNSFLMKKKVFPAEGDEENKENLDCLEKIPGIGIGLVIFVVSIYQGGNVIAKKMDTSPFLMIFLRDVFSAILQVPINVATNTLPFTKGTILLNMVRAIATAILLCGYFNAVRHLPLADVMMISSIRPATTTLLSCLILKEACGAAEILNLMLVVAGIFLVVQPSFIFNTSSQQYTSHMIYTALFLLTANVIGSLQVIIIRYIRDVHWASQALTCRIFIMVCMLGVVIVFGPVCLPECGYERLGILILALIGTISGCLTIKALQLEEAHIISLVENAGSIVVSLLFQIIIFNDIPNTIKIVGALLTLTSIIIIGVQKIMKARQISCSSSKLKAVE